MAWVVAQDVIDAWIGDAVPADPAKVTIQIGKAERLVRSKVPDLQARIDGGLEPDLLETARDVVVEVVSRKFRNPEGLRQVQETTGPFSGSRTYGGDEPGALYLTDDELVRLSGGAGGSQRAFTVSTTPSDALVWRGPEVWL